MQGNRESANQIEMYDVHVFLVNVSIFGSEIEYFKAMKFSRKFSRNNVDCIFDVRERWIRFES